MGFPDILAVTTDYVGRYLNHLKADTIAVTTISNRRNILLPFFRRVNKIPEDVTLDDIERYLFERALELKPSSLQIEKQALRGFFRYCYEYHEMDIKFRWDVIQRKKVKVPKIKTFGPEEVAKVVATCSEEQDRLIISLMFESGMRIGEVINLKSGDIEGTRIYVRGKGENDRLVFITETLAKAIYSYVVKRGHYKGHVFIPLQRHNNHPNNRYTSAYGVRGRIQRAFRDCGFTMHPHQLRHSFAKNWLMQKGDLRTLQLLLGHTDLTTTQRYLGLTDLETQAIYHQVQTTSVLATE